MTARRWHRRARHPAPKQIKAALDWMEDVATDLCAVPHTGSCRPKEKRRGAATFREVVKRGADE